MAGWLLPSPPTTGRVVLCSYPIALMLWTAQARPVEPSMAGEGDESLRGQRSPTTFPSLFKYFSSSMFFLSCDVAVVCQSKKAGSKQMANSIHQHRRGFNTIYWQCRSCTATVQPSVLGCHSLLILPPVFRPLLSEISCVDVFFPAAPWPSSWPLCVERRWPQAAGVAAGRSPGEGEMVDACPCSGGGPAWSGADARGKGHLSPPQPWTRPCSLLRVAPG